MFDYDQTALLDIKEAPVENKKNIKVHDISYGSKSERVSAYLIVPSGKGPFAAMIFLHGGGQDRSAFLEEALSLTKMGVVSLLIDEPSIRAMPHFTEPEVDRDRYLKIVVNLRRGVDLLISRPDVDRRRIGYVGISFGAWMGAILASVDKRIKACVLIAGLPSSAELWRSSEHPMAVQVRRSLTKEQLERYLETTGPLDAIYFINHVAPSALFFQFGRQDEIITAQAAVQYEQAGSQPKTVKWYDARHENIITNPAALHDRAEWLRRRLKLHSPN